MQPVLVQDFIEFFKLLRLKANKLNKPKEKYTGPLFDAMGQINNNVPGELIIEAMKKTNVRKLALFARYSQEKDGRRHTLEIAKKYPQFILLGTTKRNDQRDDLSDEFIDQIMNEVNAGCKFIGELHYNHADKQHVIEYKETNLTGERYVDPNGPNSRKLMDFLRGKNIPVMAHWENYNWERDWPSFDKLFSDYRDINFIIPHCAYTNQAYANEIMTRHSKNVYMTLSKKDMFHFRKIWLNKYGDWVGRYSLLSREKQAKLESSMLNLDGSIKRDWLAFLHRWQDNIMFATDCHTIAAWEHYDEIIDVWREIIAQMPQHLRQKIAYSNAQKLYERK
jgi:Amidohydrolase